MDTNKIISETLRLPKDAIVYSMGETLKSLRPGKTVLHGEVGAFDVEQYSEAGLCEIAAQVNVFNDIATAWYGEEYPLYETVRHGWHNIVWQGLNFELVRLSVLGQFRPDHYFWLIGASREKTETFYTDVCRWNSATREEVWIFEGGCWQKSKKLFASIQDSTFDRLILPGTLRDEMQADFKQFFDSKEVYARYRVPWKRGVLLIGPPGNGKTYTVKAMINWLGVACLYVKSFKAQHATEHASIHSVFERARKTTPCILVFEDLDSLINDKNRSYFLNEMDGFMSNDGVFVLATTNHPERLDPAIMDRPSRFDRKYHFELPDAALRGRFMTSWNATVESELQLSADAVGDIVNATEGFSFAYLKELWLSSMMRWINSVGMGSTGPGPMDSVMTAQVAILREQMTAAKESDSRSILEPSDIVSMTTRIRRQFGAHHTQYFNVGDGPSDDDEDDE